MNVLPESTPLRLGLAGFVEFAREAGVWGPSAWHPVQPVWYAPAPPFLFRASLNVPFTVRYIGDRISGAVPKFWCPFRA